MSRAARFLLGLWGLAWATVWFVAMGSLFLLGTPFFRGAWWTSAVQTLFSRFILIGIGVRVRVEGKEHVNPAEAVVLVSNHRSYLDIPALVLGLRGLHVLFVAKRELTRIPFFGWALAASRHIKVNRRDREQAIQALEKAMRRIGTGIGLAVFPEGTRSRTHQLLPFKKGGFYVAVDTGFPILPISIRNSGHLLGKMSLLPRPGVITVIVHPPVETKGKKRSDIPNLIQEVRGIVQSGLQETPVSGVGRESA